MEKSLKRFLQEERNKLKEMRGKQKFGYIWEYYKLHIIGIVVFAIFIGSLLNNFLFNPQLPVFANVSFYGDFVPAPIMQALGMDILELMEIEDMRIDVINFSFSEIDPAMYMAQRSRFGVMVAAQVIDILVVENSFLDELYPHGFGVDLREFFDSDFVEQNYERIFWGYTEDDFLPIGISLAGVEVFQAISPNFEEWTIIILPNSERQEAARELIEGIL